VSFVIDRRREKERERGEGRKGGAWHYLASFGDAYALPTLRAYHESIARYSKMLPSDRREGEGCPLNFRGATLAWSQTVCNRSRWRERGEKRHDFLWLIIRTFCAFLIHAGDLDDKSWKQRERERERERGGREIPEPGLIITFANLVSAGNRRVTRSLARHARTHAQREIKHGLS